MKRYKYRDYEMILATDKYQNYLILRNHAGICFIIAADLSDDDIDDIQCEFEDDVLTDEYFDYDGLPFKDLSSFTTWKIIA